MADRPAPSSALGHVFTLLVAFVASAVVIGVLSAGLLLPGVGSFGAATRSMIGLFDSLPSTFQATQLAQQSKIVMADGTTVIATPQDQFRILTTLDKVAPIMQTAQVAIEDDRFYEHGGMDLRGVVRAVVSNAQDGGSQGASTLTQQFVKLTLQYSAIAAGDTSKANAAVTQKGIAGYTRKLQELKYAVDLEKSWSKQQILQGYLNIVYYGDQAYGVEAASQHYFSHSAATLSLPEAALLAGLTQNPGTTDPVHAPDKALARRNVVLNRMHDLNLISDKDWTAAKAVPLKDMLKVQQPPSTCQASPYPYLCDYTLAWLRTDPSLDAALGKTVDQRNQKILGGGLTIQTSFDPRIQQLAQDELVKRVPIGNDNMVGAATVSIEPSTGYVKAFAQNTNYDTKSTTWGRTTINYAVDQQYGGSIGFAFGSTIKALSLATALQQGMPITATVDAKQAGPHNAATYTNKDPGFGGQCGLGTAPWTVTNDENTDGGRMTLINATKRSINTAFVALAQQVGPCNVLDTETKFGLHQGNGKPLQAYPSSIILGSDSVSPMTVASAYGTLAAEGKHCTPRPVVAIAENGKQLPIGQAGADVAQGGNCTQVADPDVARGVSYILQNVMGPGGTGSASALAGGREAAGKTGTTDSGKGALAQSWFVGYTPQLVTSVWVGHPVPGGKTDLDNVRLAGVPYQTVFGASIAAPTWKAIMDGALTGVPNVPFTDPSSKIINGDLIDIPNVGGRSIADATTLLQQAGFQVDPSTSQVYSGWRAGVVAGTQPSGQTFRGAIVKLLVSAGPTPVVPPPVVPPPVLPGGGGPGGGGVQGGNPPPGG